MIEAASANDSDSILAHPASYINDPQRAAKSRVNLCEVGGDPVIYSGGGGAESLAGADVRSRIQSQSFLSGGPATGVRCPIFEAALSHLCDSEWPSAKAKPQPPLW